MTEPMKTPSDPSFVQGRLLLDPRRAPELGWLRIEGERIAEVGFGDLPRGAGPPDTGGAGRLVCPAFTDAHMHFPQIDSIGCDGLELLEWLQRVIFPAEAWWGKGAALPAVRTAIHRLATQGTFGVAGYLTSHAEGAAQALDYLSNRSHLRFHVGRVAMDRNAMQELTREDVGRAQLRPIPSPIMPAPQSGPRQRVSANPRFAISCTPELLAEVGWAARDRPEAMIQTHLAESVPECAEVRRLFPDEEHYTAVYDRFGLLTDRTLLAHCVHLADEEWSLIRERGSIVVHCPAANIFLRAGLFNLDKAREHGVRLALGSDVAAGSDIAMPRVARGMIETAKVRSMTGSRAVHIPSPADAWEIITRTNAELLGWADAGRIEAGCWADLLVLRVPETWLDEHLVGRLVYGWASGLIESRIMAGRPIDPDRM